MSTFTQDSRPFTRGYGKSTGGSHNRGGDRYGNQRRNSGGSTNKRENNQPPRQENVSPTIPSPPRQYDINAGPPPWLDAYLENFKKNLISEITDDIMKALDVSYKNDTDKRKFKSCYFALKKRLTYFETQKAAENSQQNKTQQQQSTSSDVNNEENNHEAKKPHEKFFRPRNGRNGNYNKRFNESASLSSNGANATNNSSSSSSTTKIANGHQKHVIEEPTVGDAKEEIIQPTKITEETSRPIIIIDNSDNIIGDEAESVVKTEVKNVESSSLNKMTSSEEIFNPPALTKESTKSLKEIFKMLDDNKSDKKISSATDQSAAEDVEMNKSLRKKILNLLNKLTCENIDILGKQVKELEMKTLEKQREVVNVFVERAIAEPLYSVVYAQMCKKMAVQHECVAAFREMLIARCHAELMRHKEEETIRRMKIKEAAKCHDEDIKVEFGQKKSYEFMGAILFIGELYNQDLLTDIIVEKCLQCLLQNGTEIDLEYLCHLLCLIGKNYGLHEKSVAPYMDHLVELRETSEIGVNLTMLINSVVELMGNNWEPLIPDASSETTDFEDAADE